MKTNDKTILISDKLYLSQKEYYSQTYAKAGFAPWDDAFDKSLLLKTLKAFGPTKGKMALEIGSGRGRGATILLSAGYRAIGVDYLLEPLRQAATSAKKSSPLFIHADVFAPPFKDSSFSVLLDWGLFHHIRRSDTKDYIDTVSGLLKPDGHLILGCFSTRFRHDINEKRKRNWTRHRGHYDRFSTKKELKTTFSPYFVMGAMRHNPKGFWQMVMAKR